MRFRQGRTDPGLSHGGEIHLYEKNAYFIAHNIQGVSSHGTLMFTSFSMILTTKLGNV